MPWTSDEQRVAGTKTLARQSELTGTLTNVSSVTIDARRAGLTGAVAYDITSDGPARLRLSDGRALELAAGRSRGTLAR